MKTITPRQKDILLRLIEVEIDEGKEEVNKYLSGKYLVPYEARECFSYMFIDD
jgi:hypothetical protein